MVTIRACQERDLTLLRAHIPTPGQPDRHDTRFERQQRSHSTFLIAWIDDLPVAAGEILWNGCAAAEINQHYPDCPELNGLDVWPPERRSQGIGTALITAAENLAANGVTTKSAWASTTGTPAPRPLPPTRLQETGRHYLDRYHYTDSDGTRQDIADPARFLVKTLQQHTS